MAQLASLTHPPPENRKGGRVEQHYPTRHDRIPSPKKILHTLSTNQSSQNRIVFSLVAAWSAPGVCIRQRSVEIQREPGELVDLDHRCPWRGARGDYLLGPYDPEPSVAPQCSAVREHSRVAESFATWIKRGSQATCGPRTCQIRSRSASGGPPGLPPD